MSGLAMVLGLEHEPPVRAVIQALASLELPHVVIDQRKLITGTWRTSLTNEGISGEVFVDGSVVSLCDVLGVYTRLTSWSELPEVVAAPDNINHAYGLHEAIDGWLETTGARVVNRTSANDSNNSKPYQSLIIRDYFHVPATLVTNDATAVTPFIQEFGRVIYKSASGERSIVTTFGAEDMERLHLLATCPVQFQEYVPGLDVRVHVIGSEVFATSVESQAVDYRYDTSGEANLEPVILTDEVAGACVDLTAQLGLELSGIDLRYADDGRIVCFEVNPSPAFSVYEDATGQSIAAAIARRISGI
jgi:hypothetical protein